MKKVLSFIKFARKLVLCVRITSCMNHLRCRILAHNLPCYFFARYQRIIKRKNYVLYYGLYFEINCDHAFGH